MIINHNIMASNALRNMNINSNKASKAMEKLSSGLRINSAADDAAGLAISEKMRGQINGLDQAASNAQDAISLAQTGEGALNETHSILQRMRELAVQSASDTNTQDDRTKIQGEVDQLAKEITRISNTTEFNTQNLLAGGFNDTFQVGANQGQNITLGINAMDAKTLGVSRDALTGAIVSGSNAAKLASTEVDEGIETTDKLTTGNYTVTVAGTNSTIDAGSTGITGETVTGAPTADYAVTFTYHAAVTGADATIAAAQAGASTSDTLAFDSGKKGAEYNGIKIIMSTTSAGTAPKATWNQATNEITIALGSTQTSNIDTGIQAALRAVGGTGIVTKTDGTTADFTAAAVTGAGAFATAGGGAANTAATGTFTFGSTPATAGVTQVTANWSTSGASGATFAASYAGNPASISANGSTISFTGVTGNNDGESITITGTKDTQYTAQLFDAAGTTAIGNATKIDQSTGGTYMIGKTGQRMDVTFDADAAAVGSSTVNVSQTKSTATDFEDGQKVSDANVSGGIDVSTQKSADKAITIINKAITTVSEERSKLGAYQNRLEHTIANLNTSSENLTSAESRIRDVDMAKEMSEYSKNNILSQAAQAMLAQANQQPQQVLQLLR